MAEFFRHICAEHGLDSSPGQLGLTSGFVTHWVVVVLGHRKEWAHAQQVHTESHTHAVIVMTSLMEPSWPLPIGSARGRSVHSSLARSPVHCSLNTYYVLGTVPVIYPNISVGIYQWTKETQVALLLEWMFS